MGGASITKEIFGSFELDILQGDGIDICCGNDPIMPHVTQFDMADGDANHITNYVDRQFDYVFSSHGLEHMHDSEQALKEWWQLVKKGGYLFIVVPDEDLYEQGYFPSVANDDHKATFTICKNQSWSPKSYNVLDLVQTLKGGELIKLELQDNNYNRSYLSYATYSSGTAKSLINFVRKFSSLFKGLGLRQTMVKGARKILKLPIDQTNVAAAQIFFLVKKLD